MDWPTDASHVRFLLLGTPPCQTALPESCGYLRKDFGAYIFDYTAAWSSNATVPDHCTLE